MSQNKILSVIEEGLSSKKEEYQKLLRHTNFDDFKSAVINCFSVNYKLQIATLASIGRAIRNAAIHDIPPDGEMGIIIHFSVNDKKSNQSKIVATFVPTYKGLLNSLAMNGKLKGVQTEIVRSGDRFSIHASTDALLQINHEFDPNAKDRGELLGAYCIVHYNDGRFAEYMTEKEIESRKNKVNKLWEKNKEEMWKKTVLKNLIEKRFPRYKRPKIVEREVDDLPLFDEEGRSRQ